MLLRVKSEIKLNTKGWINVKRILLSLQMFFTDTNTNELQTRTCYTLFGPIGRTKH